MTRDQFAEAYARRSGTTVARLKAWGREPRPCDCGAKGCGGWQMAHLRDLDVLNQVWPEDSPRPIPKEATP